MQLIRTAFRHGVLFAALAVPTVSAQDAPLSLQERARLQFEELHEAMQRLQVALAEVSPDESQVLQTGNKYVQEMRVPELMTEAKSLLAAGRWDEAIERMETVREKLQTLMNLLLNRDLDLADLLEEIEKLEKFVERVDELIEEQHAEKEDAARAEALQKHLEELEAAQQEIADLKAAQQELREQANAAGMSASEQASRAMSEREGELAEEAAELAEKAAELEKKQQELSEGADGESKSGAPGAGSGACQGAAGAMGKAEKKLGQNQPESSLEDMDQALKELDKAAKALAEMAEEARRDLLELPFEQQATAQEKTRVATDKLAQDMENSAQGEDGEAQKATPGTENVQQAVPKQKAAAGQLKERKPGDAKQEQQDAQEQLEDAKQKLEDALAQLRQQLVDEVLRALEERFAAMLAEQEELSARTAVTDRLRGEALTADGRLPAAMVERCREFADGEHALAAEANDALKLLEEEGTTAVFPELVEELHTDLNKVGERLAGNRTGGTTRTMQTEIEDTLRMLIDALRKSIEDSESQGAGQCDGQPPLVPMSAELKLILALQKRVHARTVDYDKQVPEQMRVTEEAQDEATEIARKQGRVQDLTRKLAIKLNKESEAQENR